MASNQSVVDLMNVIANTPAVDADTRVRAAMLAHKLQEHASLGWLFDGWRHRP